MRLFSPVWPSVYTNLVNRVFPLGTRLPCTPEQCFRPPKTDPFENALYCGKGSVHTNPHEKMFSKLSGLVWTWQSVNVSSLPELNSLPVPIHEETH